MTMADVWVCFRVPESLRVLFEKMDKELGLGYTSFAEFVKEAIRRRFEEIETSYREKQ